MSWVRTRYELLQCFYIVSQYFSSLKIYVQIVPFHVSWYFVFARTVQTYLSQGITSRTHGILFSLRTSMIGTMSLNAGMNSIVCLTRCSNAQGCALSGIIRFRCQQGTLQRDICGQRAAMHDNVRFLALSICYWTFVSTQSPIKGFMPRLNQPCTWEPKKRLLSLSPIIGKPSTLLGFQVRQRLYI